MTLIPIFTWGLSRCPLEVFLVTDFIISNHRKLKYKDDINLYNFTLQHEKTGVIWVEFFKDPRTYHSLVTPLRYVDILINTYIVKHTTTSTVLTHNTLQLCLMIHNAVTISKGSCTTIVLYPPTNKKGSQGTDRTNGTTEVLRIP